MKTLSVLIFLFTGVCAGSRIQKSNDPKPVNLKVLDPNISHEQLDKLMDSFNEALQVKCSYCHIRDTTTNKLNFALDGKPEKEIARKMIQMTDSINVHYFSFKADLSYTARAVTCYTCHNGEPIPLTKADTTANKKP